METAKLFQNGSSQAVRLPKEFRIPGKNIQKRQPCYTGAHRNDMGLVV
jgi:hypothetical protein